MRSYRSVGWMIRAFLLLFCLLLARTASFAKLTTGGDFRNGRLDEAAATPDPRRRAEALWPFLSMKEYGPNIREHTESVLQKIAPVSGDYFSEQFDGMPRWERADLFKNAAAYGGDKLHATLAN